MYRWIECVLLHSDTVLKAENIIIMDFFLTRKEKEISLPIIHIMNHPQVGESPNQHRAVCESG